MKKKVVIAGVVVAVIAVAAGISAMRKKPVEEETLIPVVNVENPQMGSIELYRSLVGIPLFPIHPKLQCCGSYCI